MTKNREILEAQGTFRPILPPLSEDVKKLIEAEVAKAKRETWEEVRTLNLKLTPTEFWDEIVRRCRGVV